jgi:hypothetical protein
LLPGGTIRERPVVGLAHACVFWWLVGFARYTLVEFAYGLNITDLRQAQWFGLYQCLLASFAICALSGIAVLLLRRTLLRPRFLGRTISRESVVIALFISILMTTFLLTFRPDDHSIAGRVNWWIHALIV